jgi:DNA-binding beta-propeller fold protein YncE
MANGFRRLAATGLLVLAASCAARTVPQQTTVYFPPAPAPPRIQYLTSLSGLKDIETQSSFNRFVAGEKEDLKLDKPYGVAVYDGKIYVCDTNATVFVFDLKAKTFGPLKGAVGPGRLMQPSNVSVDGEGTKYVADPVRGQVVAFDRNDEYSKAYGLPGDWRPVDAVAFEERLYVADPANHVVKIFDKQSGDLIKSIGNAGEPTERLQLPTNLAFDREGFVYVTDASRFQILKFDRDGHFQSVFGKPGDNLGHFARPKGTALDRDGRLYAVDASFNNVQIFSRDGRLLMFFGGGGESPGDFLLPAKVTIDYDNVSYFQQYVHPDFQVEYLIFVTSQFGPRLVNVLAYGKQHGQIYPADEELLKQIEERRNKELEKLAKP